MPKAKETTKAHSKGPKLSLTTALGLLAPQVEAVFIAGSHAAEAYRASGGKLGTAAKEFAERAMSEEVRLFTGYDVRAPAGDRWHPMQARGALGAGLAIGGAAIRNKTNASQRLPRWIPVTV